MAEAGQSSKTKPFFHFGPYKLQTHSKYSSLSFRSKSEMKPEEQCLMDNLWNHRSLSKYADIIHALGHYFTYLNTVIFNQEKTLQSIHSDRFGNLSLGPQKPVSELEKENKMLSVSLKEQEKVIRELKEKLSFYGEKEKEWEEMKNEGKRILREREEKMILIPEKIVEVKERILMEICAERIAEMANVQQRLEKGVHSTLPHGMEVTVLSYRGLDHNQQICTCPKGFNFFRVSLNLLAWKDIDEDFNFATFFKQGIIRRVIVTQPIQVTKFISPISWRLAHVLYECFETGRLGEEGFINLQFQSVPSAYGGKAMTQPYPDEARHEILISPEYHGVPLQEHLLPRHYKPNKRDTIEQLEEARCYFKANAVRMSWYKKFPLLFEEHTMKAYGDKSYNYNYNSVYVPFLRHVDENPAKTHHYLTMHIMEHTMAGDHRISILAGDPEDPYYTSEGSNGSYDLDGVGIANLENMMEA